MKGKGKTKSKGKDGGKSFAKGGKGFQSQVVLAKGKGKSDKSGKQCHRCGGYGHFSKDCWAKVRNVQGGEQAQGSPSSTGGGSTAFTRVSKQQPASSSTSSQLQQRTQYRVSQVSCHFGTVTEDVGAEPLVFDSRHFSFQFSVPSCRAAVFHW